MLDQSKPSKMPANEHVKTFKNSVPNVAVDVIFVKLSNAAGVDFWSEVGPHSEQVDLMVEPSQVSKVNPYVITPACGTIFTKIFICTLYIDCIVYIVVAHEEVK